MSRRIYDKDIIEWLQRHAKWIIYVNANGEETVIDVCSKFFKRPIRETVETEIRIENGWM